MIRVFMLAEMHLYSRALAQLLAEHETLRMVGSTRELSRALGCLGDLRPDIVLLDMGTANSAVAVRAIADAAPDIKVVVFGISADEGDLVACARARVAGYVSPEEGPEDLLVTIQSVARGEMRCSPRTASALLDRLAALATRSAPESVDTPLTTREIEVMELVERGLSNKEIARGLSIQLPTVKNHVHNILGKLKVNRRTEAVARIRRGASPSDQEST